MTELSVMAKSDKCHSEVTPQMRLEKSAALAETQNLPVKEDKIIQIAFCYSQAPLGRTITFFLSSATQF